MDLSRVASAFWWGTLLQCMAVDSHQLHQHQLRRNNLPPSSDCHSKFFLSVHGCSDSYPRIHILYEGDLVRCIYPNRGVLHLQSLSTPCLNGNKAHADEGGQD
jgi:hypothetical protein